MINRLAIPRFHVLPSISLYESYAFVAIIKFKNISKINRYFKNEIIFEISIDAKIRLKSSTMVQTST